MPPKPFKPPRANASTSSSKKPSTSAKKSTAKPKAPGTAKASGITKAKSKQSYSKGKVTDVPRISAASRLSLAGLPSLSPDSDDEIDRQQNRRQAGRENDEEEEEDQSDVDDEEEEAEVPSSPPRRKSITTAANTSTKPKPRASTSNLAPGEGSPELEATDAIPLDLLNVLLHQFYKEPNTRMSKEANRAVGRYMETFVREALARVAYHKGGGDLGVQGGGEVLEVEDLERAGPQLLLDF